MKPGDALCIIECDGGSYLFVPGHQDGPLQLITNVRPIPSERITSIAKAVQECAYSWEPTAQILGNISAEDVADLCSAVLPCPVESDGLSDLSVYSYDAGESVRISRMGESALWCITTHGVIPDWWFNLGMHYDFASAGAAFAAIKLAQQAVKESGQVAAVEICHVHKDGECHWEQCPQLRDGEPAATRRSCPLPLDPDDIERAELDALRGVPVAVGKWEDGFMGGVCVALATVTAHGDSVIWREIVRSVGVDNALNYAANVNPEDWELAGFSKYAQPGLGKDKPPPSPPAGEPGQDDVGELIHCLRIREQSLSQQSYNLVQLGDAAYFGRAATRLEQQEDKLAAMIQLLATQLTEPAKALVAPVNELPWNRPGWCDAEGRCWLCNAYSMGRWNYDTPPDPAQDWGRLGTVTHSAPHWAIPRPPAIPRPRPVPRADAGEVQG